MHAQNGIGMILYHCVAYELKGPMTTQMSGRYIPSASRRQLAL